MAAASIRPSRRNSCPVGVGCRARVVTRNFFKRHALAAAKRDASCGDGGAGDLRREGGIEAATGGGDRGGTETADETKV